LSQYLETLNVGNSIKCRGPVGKLKYFGNGTFEKFGVPLENKTKIGLIAGGTGITPMLSIAQASLLSGEGFKISMLYSNKTLGDILCKDILDDLA
jgi:ferredoxin-NADP reductase